MQNKTVAQLLVELKLLDKRITNAVANGCYIVATQGDKVPNGFKTKEDVDKHIISGYQSVVDLIENRNKIKSALVLSNATTQVTVGSKTMTVAEAIERKSSIEYQKTLLSHMASQLQHRTSNIEAGNRDVRARLDKLLEVTLGKDSKTAAADSTTYGEDFLKKESWVLIDPLNLREKVATLQAEIEEFESNVDLALSVSNATTSVVIQ